MCVVVEAEGMLAGRSGWIEIGKDSTLAAPAIVLKRLTAVRGKVVDRAGRPVAGVSVFNSGDGHERVEAMTGPGGKFLLNSVPEGAVFLFAEKPGYRFTATHLHRQAKCRFHLDRQRSAPSYATADSASA